MDALKVLLEEASRGLDFIDFVRISETCKTLNTYMKNIKFGVYNINALDYSVYRSVRKDFGGFLYNEKRPQVVKRFLELFGYTYDANAIYGAYDVRNSKWINFPVMRSHPLKYYCENVNYELAVAIIDFNPSLAITENINDSPFLIAIIYSYDITKYILENCNISMDQIQSGIRIVSSVLGERGIVTRELLTQHRDRILMDTI
jgi:hypothetical protein